MARVNPINSAGTRVPVVNTVRATTDGDSDFGTDSASATLRVLVPDVSLSMQVRNFNGGTFASSVDVQNGAQLEIRWTLAASTASAAGVDISDVLPAGVTFVRTTSGPPGSGNFCSGVGQVVVCHVSGLAPGIGATFGFVVAVNANLSGTGPFVTLTNTAQVSNTVDADPSNNSASVAVNVGRPEVSLRMTVGPASGSSILVDQNEGLQIDVYVSVSAAGAGTIVFSDTLPSGLTYVRSTVPSSARCTGTRNMYCTLSPGPSNNYRGWHLTFYVRASADLTGTGPFVTLTNTASVRAFADADPSNNTASIDVNVRRPDVSLFMGVREPSGNGPFGLSVTVTRGAALEIEWRVEISNAGIVPITVTDTLPAGLTFIGTTSVPGGSLCGSQGQVVTCQISSSSSNFWIFRFLVAVSAQLVVPDTLINTAEVSAISDADPSNNSASVTVNVVRRRGRERQFQGGTQFGRSSHRAKQMKGAY